MRISTKWPNFKWYWGVVGLLLPVLIVVSIIIWQRNDTIQPPTTSNEEIAPYEPYISQFADTESAEIFAMAINGQFTEALARVDEHLSSDSLTAPERAWLLQAKASVLIFAGDAQTALAAELAAIELAPELPILYASTASIYGDYLEDRVKAKEYADMSLQKYDAGGSKPYLDTDRKYFEGIVEKWQ